LSLTQQSIEFSEPVWKVVFQKDTIGICSKNDIQSNYYLLDSDSLEVIQSIESPDFGGVEVLKGVEQGRMIFDVFPDMTDPAKYSTVALDLQTGDYQSFQDVEASIESLSIPLRYLEGTEYFDKVCGFIEMRTSRKPVTAVDYLELPKHLIVSYYLYTETGLSLILNIFNAEGQTLYESFLDRNLQAIGS
jgi:hypothetical protein